MKGRYGLEEFYYQKRKFVLQIVLTIARIFLIFAGIRFSLLFVRNNIFDLDSVSSLYKNWDLHTIEGYSNVYNTSNKILEEKRFHNAALTMHGYSAFMLAESENDSMKAQDYLDEAVFSLRNSLVNCKKDTEGQIYYMLGRSYFYKNKISAYHYYSDLVVKYLQKAQELGYKADDIPLLMGLSYASLGETDKSISSFTEALLDKESDTLLFNIAKQYYSNLQGSVAKQYLFRVLDSSEDENLLEKSHFLMAQIYLDEDKFDEAENEFNKLLEMNENSADAHYGLGILYEKLGDTVKARAEWRKTLKIQFNHPGALSKMSDNK